MGEPQTENTLDKHIKHKNCGSKLIEAEIILSFKQGRLIWQPEGIIVVTVDLRETRMDPQGPMWHLLLQHEKPQIHLTSPLPAVAESKTTLIVNTAQQLAVAELNNHFCKSSCVLQRGLPHALSFSYHIHSPVYSQQADLSGPDRGHW